VTILLIVKEIGWATSIVANSCTLRRQVSISHFSSRRAASTHRPQHNGRRRWRAQPQSVNGIIASVERQFAIRVAAHLLATLRCTKPIRRLRGPRSSLAGKKARLSEQADPEKN